MKQLFTFFLLLIVGYSQANQIVLPYFSKWKYLDNGTDQGTSWRGSAFNDASWNAGYAQLGYGDGDERTTVSYGPNINAKYITTYLRKVVSITNIASYTNFTLNIRRDDGAIIYINGVEAYRTNMTASPAVILYNTVATAAASDDGNTPQTASLASTFFTSGNNTIAVEIHQSVNTTSDLTFDLELIGNQTSSPTLTRGPYLQIATPTSIKVRWRTATTSNSRVYYGATPTSLTNQANDATLVTEHILPLTGLTPNTKYYYAIGSSSSLLMGDDENYFITPPIANTVKPSRIWVTGDFGSGLISSDNVRNAYQNYTGNTYTDLWLWLGDNAYNSGLEAEFTSNVFTYRYESIFKKTCVWPAPGNHDYGNVGYQNATALGTNFHYFTAFASPQAGEAGGVASSSPKYYSFNYSNIHFISLDSYGALNTPGSPMYNWLVNDLNANQQKWTIVYFHHPPYSKGSHDSDTESELVNMRTNIVPVLESHKVDLVLSGHSHSYERSFLIKNHLSTETTFAAANQVDAGSGITPTPYIKTNTNGFTGTVYAVVGCSGQSIGGTKTGYPHNAMYTSDVATYGSMVIDVNGDTLNAKLITNNLTTPTLLDQFTIIRQCNLTVTLNPISSLCTTSSPLTLTGGNPSGGTYSGTGVNANIFNPTTAGAGTHNITYTYTDAYGCSASASQLVVVNPILPTSVSIAITTGSNPQCSGSSSIFSATPINGGATPSYQWKKNGINTGLNSSTYSVSSLTNGNTIQCVMTSNSNCVSGNPSSSNTITMVVNTCVITLNLRLFIQGLYNPTTNLMPPLIHTLGFNPNINATDSITIQLRNSLSLTTVTESKRTVLLTDGYTSTTFTNAIQGQSYYIVVKHRNSIETWSKNAVLFTGSPVTFDFTTP